jgi:cell division protein FtsX
MKQVAPPSPSLRRAVNAGLLLLRRDNSWGTTLTLLTAILFLVQLLVIAVLGVSAVNGLLSSRAALRLEVLSTAGTQDVQNFFATVRSRPEVAAVAYVTKQQAYDEQRKTDPDLVAFLDQYKLDNPFPDTFVVTLSSLSLYGSFRQFLEQPQWKTIINPSFLSQTTDQERQVESLLQISTAIRSVTFFFLFVAFVVLLFLVLEMVSRTVQERGRELFLESVLGASALSMLLPIMAGMAILLITAVILATVLALVFALALPFFIPSLAAEAPFSAFSSEIQPLLLTVFPWIVLLELCVMPLLAYVGAFIGAGRKIESPLAFLP